MVRAQSPSHVRLFGRDRTKTRWFVTSAVALCGLTLGLAAAGDALLSVWPRLYAHLVIESVAILVFACTFLIATANGYLNDGVVTSVVVTAAPLVGLFLYLAVDTLLFGATVLTEVTLDSLVSLGGAVGAIGLASYLLGMLLSFRRPPTITSL
ncbi:hypothetical protein [Haloplanus aerogenes]|uniref:Uncharacterized protein n=1 Tax=Haloplanus aerogenes TaxID=660522 RepID=A0A3M0CVX1_9EURY|nr:hypothetical protein [Haloplanus aerogenes]AZH27071.1 hypothetical protein DU502_17575 [Haloplanus aerogenes]RMB13431.1 hypothetical protein ATH50_2764 [Haloplanus aerogenes]